MPIRPFRSFLIVAVALLLASALAPQAAVALPTLQLHIEGSTYDPVSETWAITASDFTLWAIGDIKLGDIHDVTLTISFSTGETGTITLTPTVADPALLPAADPSTPGAPVLVAAPMSAASPSGGCVATTDTAGRIPCMGSGRHLPGHGEFGGPTEWQQFDLGDFTLADTPIGDWTDSVPDPASGDDFPAMGQINAYDVSVTGFTALHFDLFGDLIRPNPGVRSVFAPFSHDAQTTPNGSVPMPPSLLLLVGAAAPWLAIRHVGRRRSAP
ncbi:MAG: choice-of-anchor N protein [Candidatus Rokuibacteriota bacterium]